MDEHTIVTPPNICGFAEIELAHRQMQQHRACQVNRCAWKRAAYYTLVGQGRIAPPTLSPRERAHLRGIDFPAANIDHRLSPSGAPEIETFQQVLDGLSKLARDLRVHSSDSLEG